MKNQIQTIELFTTKDQSTSILLFASGQKLDSTDWQNGACYFIFEDKPKCEEIIANHYNGQIKLSTKVIFEAMKTIKGIILSR